MESYLEALGLISPTTSQDIGIRSKSDYHLGKRSDQENIKSIKEINL